MSDPAAFPMFKGGYPLTAAGKAGLAKSNPRNDTLLKWRRRHPAHHHFSAADRFPQGGRTIVIQLKDFDSVRTIHMNPKAVAPRGALVVRLFAWTMERHDVRRQTDHIAAGYSITRARPSVIK